METTTNKTTRTDLFNIDPRNIVVEDNFNARVLFTDIEELAEQIKLQGVLNPISVIPFKDENGNDKYRLIDGERRYRAIMSIIEQDPTNSKVQLVPAIKLPKNTTREDLLIQQAMRNEGRNFTSYELGIFAKKLMDECGMKARDVAHKLGKNEGAISRALGYLEYDERLQKFMADGTISPENLNRIYNAHNKNADETYNEIIGLKMIAVNGGKDKVSLKDLDKNARTIQFHDTKAINKGLKLFFDYLKKYSEENPNKKININFQTIMDMMKDGKVITEVFDSIAIDKDSEYRKAE